MAFRGNNHPGDTRPTIVMTMEAPSATTTHTLEFFLDATDGSGNLVKRRDVWTATRNPSRVQLDEYSGNLLACRSIRQNNLDAGLDQLLTNDNSFRPPTEQPNISTNNAFFKNGIQDAAVPGFRLTVVEPTSSTNVSTFINTPASPVSFTLRHKGYSNSNSDTNINVNYTVQKAPNDASTAWLTLDKTSGGPLTPGQRDTVNGTIDTTGLAAGHHIVTLLFTDNASPPNVHSRTIDLEILECQWDVSPSGQTTTAYVFASPLPASYPMTVRALAGTAISYTVQEVQSDGVTPVDYPWLSLNKTSGGPITAGNSDTVLFTVNSPGAANTGYLRFTPSCGTATSGSQPQVRQIVVLNNTLPSANGVPIISTYQGDVLPGDANSCGVGCNFVLTADTGNMLMGSVESDPGACDQKAFRIQDDHTVNTWVHYRTSGTATNGVGDVGSGGTHDGNLGSTLLARIKVPNDTAAGTMLCINMGSNPRTAARVEWGGVGPNLPGLVNETFRASQGADNGSTSADYVIIRMTSGFGVTGSRSINVYVNENKVPVPNPLQVLGLTGLTNGASGRGIGYGFGMEGTGADTGEVWFDWVVFTTAGMYAPGEEVGVLGKSLFPRCCPNPFADADEDGDVDANDFAQFQRCYTGSAGTTTADCKCFDRNGDTHVDDFDFGDPLNPAINTFIRCSNTSRANVPADPTCDGAP